jgi:hypothetical protein
MAAKTLYRTDPGYIDRLNTGANALDKELDALVMRSNEYPVQGAQFVRNVTPKAGSYKEAQYGTRYQLPVISEDSDPVPVFNPVQGYTKSFTTTTYRLGAKAMKTLSEQELFAYAMNAINGIADSGKLLIEYSIANIINNATTATGYDGADGVPLASDSHPHERRQTGVWSNLGSAAALTHAAFSTARTAMRKRTDEFGNRMTMRASKLVVPADLEETANIIVASELKSGSSLNDKNVLKNSVEVVVYDYMTDTNAWFLMGDIKEDNRGIIFGDEVPMSIAPMTGVDTGTDVKWAERLRMRFVTGLFIAKDIEYNEGA